jgi:hypothetical protein
MSDLQQGLIDRLEKCGSIHLWTPQDVGGNTWIDNHTCSVAEKSMIVKALRVVKMEEIDE